MMRANSRYWLATLCAAVLLAGCDSPGPVTPGAAVQLVAASGSGQQGLPGVPLPAPLIVRATRPDGAPAAGVAVRWQAAPGAGSLEVLQSVTGTDGIARARWHLPQQPGAALSATAAVEGAPEAVFTAAWLPRERADLLLAGAGMGVHLLLHPAGTIDTATAFRTQFIDSLALVPFAEPQLHQSLIAFSYGHPPLVRGGLGWTDARDTVRLEFRAPVRVPLTVWIVRAPFDSVAAGVWNQLGVARGVWGTAGVDLSDVRIVDATGDPDAAMFQDSARACGTEESAIGWDEGRTNIYVTGRVQTSTGNGVGGYACSMFHVNLSAQSLGTGLLLAHELGHTFGLAHQGGPNLMDGGAMSGDLTLGQIFLAHTSSVSSIPMRHAGPSGLPVLDCHFVGRCLPSTFDF